MSSSAVLTTSAKRKILKNLPEQFEIEQELSARSLYEYQKLAWSTIEPKPLVTNWHIEAVCDHLQAVTMGHIRNLLVCIPPRHTKSMSASVMWPSWEWGPAKQPETRWLNLSYSQTLSERDAVKCRSLIQSPWYQMRWGSEFFLTGDQNQKRRYNTNHGGHRVSSSVEGMGTGEGGDRIVVDDPVNLRDIHSVAALNNVINWWQDVMPTRLNDPRKSTKTIIMQRSHDNDLVGWILRNSDEQWEKLILPAEYEKKFHCSTSLGFSDPRRKEGELLWEKRFGRSEIKGLKTSLGSYNYAAQCQQRPTPAEGGIIKRAWWKYYQQRPQDIVDSMDIVFTSWDMSFKDLEGSDYVVGGVWGIKGAAKYRLDAIRDQLSFTNTVKAMRSLHSKWPQATAHYVEDKANGTAVMDHLKSSVPGLIPFNPDSAKTSRLYAVSPDIEAGDVYLPATAPWLEEYIEEHAQFPRGAHDDQVDETSQALLVARKLIKRANDMAPVVSVTRESQVAHQVPSGKLVEGRSKWHIRGELDK